MGKFKKNTSKGVVGILFIGVGVYFVVSLLKFGGYFHELQLLKEKHT